MSHSKSLESIMNLPRSSMSTIRQMLWDKMENKNLDLIIPWFIEELRMASERSRSFGQKFSRRCRQCHDDSPDQRAFCANITCSILICT
ncbi:hypothetical protein PRIPAC_76393 [Pristionchus pacificus]|uniref:Uncharacterized protein n=1 Tax=Pristionchus pacificus TaxID=54126 RepID=A0A2A6BEP7_PRIPA|nr:hypothetical protein PRIPAC_76393 [Pristionchus pacificus]|eukprot:PDM64352.1 hypothetical protein PRIPAC_52608 [Pristionchus pacificus]